MLGLGQHWEILLPLALLAVVFFGPKRLPELGSSIGKTITEFKKASKEVVEPAATVTTQPAPQQLPAPAEHTTPAQD